MSHRQQLSTCSAYCCCCEPEFDSAVLEKANRHNALESPGTLCIRVPSPPTSGRNNPRELRAQRRHVLGDGGRGSILTASSFSYSSTIGAPAVDYSSSSTTCCCIKTWYLVGGTCGLRIIQSNETLVLYSVEPRVRFYTRARKISMKSQTEGAKGSIFEPHLFLRRKRPDPRRVGQSNGMRHFLKNCSRLVAGPARSSRSHGASAAGGGRSQHKIGVTVFIVLSDSSPGEDELLSPTSSAATYHYATTPHTKAAKLISSVMLSLSLLVDVLMLSASC